jgi:arylsulfatase A-like enzyme
LKELSPRQLEETRRSTVAVFAGLLFVSACHPAGQEGSGRFTPRGDENVILIVVDCLRPDHLRAYGYDRDTAPNIDRLRNDGIVFDTAIAQSNWTKPSIASLLTSLYVSQHRVSEGHWHHASTSGRVTAQVLNDEFVSLAEYLSKAGFATAGFVNQGHLPAAMGFSQGFDVYNHRIRDGAIPRRIAKWVNGLARRRFFAYVHFLALHSPYAPPARFDLFTREGHAGPMRLLMGDPQRRLGWRLKQGLLTPENLEELRSLYDGDLRMVDDRVGQLLRVLRERQLYDRSMIILTADHGDAFGEHGDLGHGGANLYGEVVHVPLIIKFPGYHYRGKRVTEPVQLIDVLPTILESLHVPPENEIGGRSLLGLIEGTAEPHPVLTESTGNEDRKALYHDGYKFIFDPKTWKAEVYRYGADPLDRTNLADEVDARRLSEARQILDHRLAANEAFSSSHESREKPLAPEDVEKLRSLGYVE